MCLVVQSCLTLCNSMDYSPPSSSVNSPSKNTGVGCYAFFQGIFPSQGLNPGLLHCRWILYQLSHKGSLRILEAVAYHFSSGSSWPRNQAGVSCIAGRFFTNWATVWITTNWKMLKEIGISNHLTCLLRKLYVGQEITVRTRHRTTDWLQIGKGVCQGYIPSPCLFNLYAE